MSQLGLFESGASRPPGEGSAALPRIQLDARAWVEHQPDWLAGHRDLFDALRRGIEWHAERRAMYDAVIDVPRLTATIPDDGPCPPALARAHHALERRYRRQFENLRPRVVPRRTGQRRDARRPDRTAHRRHRGGDPLPRGATAVPAQARGGAGDRTASTSAAGICW